MLQLYHCPKDGLNINHCLRSIPKHRFIELDESTSARPLKQAWGLEIVEGVDWVKFLRRFTGVALGLTIADGLVVRLSYGIVKRDF